MTSLVFCHFMNSIMNCIIVQLFCTFCNFKFTFTSTSLSSCTQFKVFLCGVCYNFTQ